MGHLLPVATLPLAGLITAIMLAGCGQGSPTGGPGEAPGQMPPPELGVFTVVAEPADLTMELVGRATPYRIAEVRPQVGGIIKSREFQEGGEITAGQPLYLIDPARYEAARDSAEAALVRARATRERAEKKAERYGDLLKNKAGSLEQFDDAQAALKESAADVQVAAITSRGEAGTPVARMFPSLRGRVDIAFSDPAATDLTKCDCVFFATPNGVAMGQARPLVEAGGSWEAGEWSPDDGKLLVMRDVSINESYPYVVDLATGTLTPLFVEGARVAYGDAVWSGDGKGVYFTSDEGSEFMMLRYFDLASGTRRVVREDISLDAESLAMSGDR